MLEVSSTIANRQQEFILPTLSVTIVKTTNNQSLSVESFGNVYYATLSDGLNDFRFKISRKLATQLIVSQFESNEASHEVEKRWRCDVPKEMLENVTYDKISQWYLIRGYLDSDTSNLESRVEVRIRKRNDQYSLTLKKGSGVARPEIEGKVFVEKNQIQVLEKFPCLKKKRYTVPITDSLFENRRKARGIKNPYQSDDLKVEFNIIKTARGLLHTAEIEFPSIESAQNFVAPSLFGREITNLKHYESANLAVLSK